MRFEDGTVASCDILIGADGIKSPVRRCLLQEKAEVLRSQGKHRDADRLLASVEPIWTGSICYRTVVPLDRVRSVLPSGHRVLQAPVQVSAHITSLYDELSTY
jgi:salicylate hydroxylase